MDQAGGICGLACSVFQPEIEILTRRGEIPFPVSHVDSRLHMQPQLLVQTLQSRIDALLKNSRGVILFFGDCHIRMHQLCANSRVVRLDGLNCGMILLGRERYRELMHQRAFLVFPEWAARWREVLEDLDAYSDGAGLYLLRDSQEKLTYLDTGSRPLPETELDACATYLGLPREVRSVPLDNFQCLIRRAVAMFDPSGETKN